MLARMRYAVREISRMIVVITEGGSVEVFGRATQTRLDGLTFDLHSISVSTSTCFLIYQQFSSLYFHGSHPH